MVRVLTEDDKYFPRDECVTQTAAGTLQERMEQRPGAVRSAP